MNRPQNRSKAKLAWSRLCQAVLIGGLLLLAVHTACRAVVTRLDQVPKQFYFSQPPLVRVALFRDVRPPDSVTIDSKGSYRIYSLSTGQLLAEGRRLRPTTVSDSPSGIAFGSTLFMENAVRVIPSRSGSLSVAGKRYFGEIHVLKRSSSLSFVNVLDLETYLSGVIGAEMPLTFPQEALRAQAIAARTYALWRMKTAQGADFDLTADQASQVYGGAPSVSPVARRVARDTQGVVLLFEGKILPAYYSSTCGGQTGSVEAVMGLRKIKPLSGVFCPFCKGSKYYRWEAAFSSAEVGTLLEKGGYSTGEIERIERTGAAKSGYGGWVKVTGRNGSVSLAANDFRMLLGSMKIKSTRFEVSRQGDYFRFAGSGFGHGVGMCQWGARGMAEKGFEALQILAYYYSGSKPVRIYP